MTATAALPLGSQLEALAKQYGVQLQQLGVEFIKGHQEDVAILGQETVQAIFAQAIQAEHISVIPPIDPNATEEDSLAIQQILEERSAAATLIAQAEVEDAQRVWKLKDDALSVAKSVGGMVASLGGAVLLKVLTAA